MCIHHIARAVEGAADAVAHAVAGLGCVLLLEWRVRRVERDVGGALDGDRLLLVARAARTSALELRVHEKLVLLVGRVGQQRLVRVGLALPLFARPLVLLARAARAAESIAEAVATRAPAGARPAPSASAGARRRRGLRCERHRRRL